MTYSFEDMAGEHRSSAHMPVAIKPADWRDAKPGICYVSPWDFDGKTGCCYQDEAGIVTLIVHSNKSYDFRILP